MPTLGRLSAAAQRLAAISYKTATESGSDSAKAITEDSPIPNPRALTNSDGAGAAQIVSTAAGVLSQRQEASSESWYAPTSSATACGILIAYGRRRTTLNRPDFARIMSGDALKIRVMGRVERKQDLLQRLEMDSLQSEKERGRIPDGFAQPIPLPVPDLNRRFRKVWQPP